MIASSGISQNGNATKLRLGPAGGASSLPEFPQTILHFYPPRILFPLSPI
jgi:hypothetical protein